jgi:predicted permease
LTGILPIALATRRNPGGILQALSHQTTSGRNRRWTQSVFVIGQVALAMLLLTAAAVTMRNLRGLLATGFGVATESRLVASVALPAYRYGSGFPATVEKINPFKEQALQRIRALPGVVDATVSNRVPLSSDWPAKFGFQVPGYQPAPGESPAYSFAYQVHPGYFQVLGMPLVRGRDLAATDDASAPPIAIISEAIARKYFSDRDPVGARITSVYGRECEIIGVVGETQNVPFSIGNAPTIYFSARQWPAFNDEAVFVVRTALPPDAMTAAVTQALLAVDPLLSVRMTDLARLQRSAVVTQSAPMEIAGSFALVAMVLTAIGLYGVLASVVAQRTRELAIRIALGASRRSIFRMVLLRGGVLALAGTALGVLVTLPMLQWIKPMLKAADATRPGTLLYTGVLILVVTLLASYLPARRAAKVDPLVALRND